MSLIEQIPLIGPFLSTLLPFLLVLSVVVFVHEYGHYIVARWCGVRSDVFSLGFGPELYGWNDKRGMRWKISAIPLGGYVKFRGDADASSGTVDQAALDNMSLSEREGAFPTAKLWKRASIVSAGPMANFILSTILFAGVAIFVGVGSDRAQIGAVVEGTPAEAAGFAEGDKLLAIDGVPVSTFDDVTGILLDRVGEEVRVEIERNGELAEIPYVFAPEVGIAEVRLRGPADEAGLRREDIIIATDGEPVNSFTDLQERIAATGPAPISITVMRDGEEVTRTLTPEIREIRNPDGSIETRPLIGITHLSMLEFAPSVESASLPQAAMIGVRETGAILTGTLYFLSELIAGRGDPGDLGGPLRIAEVSGDAAEQGWVSIIRLAAILSASIGLINLFPIPVLDGGHLLFYGIEAVRGKPLSERVQEIGMMIGFAVVIFLMVFATYNDVSRWIPA